VDSQISVNTVATLIEPWARSRIEAAAGTWFETVHASDVQDAMRAVRERPVSALLVSPTWVGQEQAGRLGHLIKAFPGIPTVAIICDQSPSNNESLLRLGASGVRRIIDLRHRDGWSRLRDLVTSAVRPASNRVLARVMPALGHASPEAERFFELMIMLAPFTPTVRLLARRIKVSPSTFMSRFMRAGLPSPKRYLSTIRLVYTSALFETPGLSISDVAYRLTYSSPQSLGRHVRAAVGMTAGEFRTRCRFDATLQDFTGRFILPFRAAFRTFRPL